jgi:hypothetical protein
MDGKRITQKPLEAGNRNDKEDQEQQRHKNGIYQKIFFLIETLGILNNRVLFNAQVKVPGKQPRDKRKTDDKLNPVFYEKDAQEKAAREHIKYRMR